MQRHLPPDTSIITNDRFSSSRKSPLAFSRFVNVLSFFKRNARMVSRIGGVLLVAVGLLEVTGAWTSAITWLHTHWFSGYNLPL